MEQLKQLLTSSDWAAKKAELAIKLTEDFKSRAAVLFESAVRTLVRLKEEEMENQLKELLFVPEHALLFLC